MDYTKHEGKMKDFYKIGKTLGEGSFAVVRDVTCLKDDSKWAAKCIDKKNLSKRTTIKGTLNIMLLYNVSSVWVLI